LETEFLLNFISPKFLKVDEFFLSKRKRFLRGKPETGYFFLRKRNFLSSSQPKFQVCFKGKLNENFSINFFEFQGKKDNIFLVFHNQKKFLGKILFS